MYLYTVYICMWNSGGHILEKLSQCWEINGNIWKYDMWNKINISVFDIQLVHIEHMECYIDHCWMILFLYVLVMSIVNCSCYWRILHNYWTNLVTGLFSRKVSAGDLGIQPQYTHVSTATNPFVFFLWSSTIASSIFFKLNFQWESHQTSWDSRASHVCQSKKRTTNN